MKARLEHSRKILLDLLETKRNKFPRFFFLSNDDLFEVLGQSKDPTKINKHINKFFPGIRMLHFQQIPGLQKGQPKKYQVIKMTSPDGEDVDLKQPQPFNKDIENSLRDLEQEMFGTVRRELYNTYMNFE